MSWQATWPRPRGAGLDRRRLRRGQGGHRPGIDLHHASHFGRGRPPDYGDLPGRPGGREDAKIPVIADGGIRYSGDMTKAIAAGAARGDDRRTVCRIGGKPRSTDPLPGTDVQNLSRNGISRRHGARFQRALPSRSDAGRTNWFPRASKGACPSRAYWGRLFTSLSGVCGLISMTILIPETHHIQHT